MRIALACYLYPPALGGVETHVAALAHRFAGAGHEVTVVTGDFIDLNAKKRVPADTPSKDGEVEVVRLKGEKYFWRRLPFVRAQKFAIRGVSEVLADGKFDIVHCHSGPSGHLIDAVRLKRKFGWKVFFTGHYSPGDLDAIFDRPLRAWAFKRTFAPLIKGIDKIIAIAESEKGKMKQYFDTPDEKVVVLPNGVDQSEIKNATGDDVAAFLEKHGLEDRKFLLFVGRVVFPKGVDLLIEAAGKTLADRKDFKVVVMGPLVNEEYYAFLKDKAADAGIADRVLFLQVPRLETVCAFKSAFASVLPSRGEVFGIVLVEGMAGGAIAIGSDSGGIPEVIDDGNTGFLFRNNDCDSLAGVLDKTLKLSPDALATIKANAKEKTETVFNWDIIARDLLNLYSAELEGRATTA